MYNKQLYKSKCIKHIASYVYTVGREAIECIARYKL